MAGQTILLLLSIFIFSIATMSTAVDTIKATQIIKDGETIVSSGGNFELGFFSPGNSKNRYVGIWYKKISKFTVVWVANRDVPVNDSSGMFQLVDQGKLVLLNSTNATVWSSNSSRPGINPVARLLDNGNFVVRDANDSDGQIFLWQSFDYPGDTFLPNVKFGIDLETGLNRYITSWKSPDDPSTGEFTNKVDQSGVPQLLLSEGSHVRFRSGHWNGLRFSGMVNLKPNPIYTFEFVFNDKEIYYEYQLTNSSVLSRMALSPEGALQRFIWVESSQSWNLYLTANPDNCDRFALCGANGVCDINNSPACGCLEGFRARSPDEWAAADWSQGCVREVELGCSVGEGFLKYPGIKLPDTRQSRYNKTMSLQECEKECLRNCNCAAYANLDIRNGGSGCILWFGELVDIRQYNEYGQDIYLRMSASEIDKYQRFKGRRRVRIIVISVVLVGVFLIAVCLFLLVLRKKKKNRREGGTVEDPGQDCTNQSNTEDIDIPLFNLATLVEATNCFSISNKLGQGGYGPVYKGILQDGQVIAVKRLSTRSRQGIEEFKNEAGCIAKLQHRNLVKLLGCCIELDERILIYEYMPNKSLDSILFDKRQSMLLNWSKRFHVINGIARGLLYLHQDSRLRIIHRDLKASNVLLDNDMNPKISDFGMARSFGEDETSANTNRIVGTYGYMSPEYAIDGLFSVKSDVFSFGVLVLETVSGRKNRGFRHSDHKLNLLGHAWMLHKKSRSWELIDASVKEESKLSEALRSIHVGLLCVQRSPEDRPNMSRVVLMLSSDITLVQPKEPGFFSERELLDSYSSSTIVQESGHESSATNELTMTLLEAR